MGIWMGVGWDTTSALYCPFSVPNKAPQRVALRNKVILAFCVLRIRNEAGCGFIKAIFTLCFFVSLFLLPFFSRFCRMWHKKMSFFVQTEKMFSAFSKHERCLKNRFGVYRMNAKQLKLLLFMASYVFYMCVLGNRSCISTATRLHVEAPFLSITMETSGSTWSCIKFSIHWGEREKITTRKKRKRLKFNFKILLLM